MVITLNINIEISDEEINYLKTAFHFDDNSLNKKKGFRYDDFPQTDEYFNIRVGLINKKIITTTNSDFSIYHYNLTGLGEYLINELTTANLRNQKINNILQ